MKELLFCHRFNNGFCKNKPGVQAQKIIVIDLINYRTLYNHVLTTQHFHNLSFARQPVLQKIHCCPQSFPVTKIYMYMYIAKLIIIFIVPVQCRCISRIPLCTFYMYLIVCLWLKQQRLSGILWSLQYWLQTCQRLRIFLLYNSLNDRTKIIHEHVSWLHMFLGRDHNVK